MPTRYAPPSIATTGMADVATALECDGGVDGRTLEPAGMCVRFEQAVYMGSGEGLMRGQRGRGNEWGHVLSGGGDGVLGSQLGRCAAMLLLLQGGGGRREVGMCVRIAAGGQVALSQRPRVHGCNG